MKVGIIAVQGAFAEHATALRSAASARDLEVEVVEVRRREHAQGCAGFVLPGGESTAIDKLLRSSGLHRELKARVREGVPVLATCAGAILLSSEGDEEVDRTGTHLLGLMDAAVDRNAFGRQRESFEAPLQVPALGQDPFPGVFIRAPAFRKTWGRSTPWAKLPDGRVVGVEQENLLALSFHPELSPDTRVHEHFLSRVDATDAT